jgi:organic radical activating enzyme
MLEYGKYREFVVDLTYDITLRCNLRCPYCYNLDILDNKTTVNEDVFNKVIDQVNRFVSNNPNYTLFFSLLGGEPLLVKDKCIEMIERIDPSVTIYVNANFDYKGSHVNGLEKYSNVILRVSWHDSADANRIKNNLLSYKGKTETTFFVTDSNFDAMYEHSIWAHKNNVPYKVESLRSMIDQEFLFTGFDTEKYKDMVSKGNLPMPRQGFHMEDETDLGLEPDQIRHVSKYYHTICKIGQYSIMFDGTVKSACGYPFVDHVNNESLDFTKSVYCNGYVCSCDAAFYKKLTKK